MTIKYKQKLTQFLLLFLLLPQFIIAQSYDSLWLAYKPVSSNVIQHYQATLPSVQLLSVSGQLEAAIKYELKKGLNGLLDQTIELKQTANASIPQNGLIVGTTKHLYIRELVGDLSYLGQEGFLIRSIKKGDHTQVILAAQNERGLLYGTFHFLRVLQQEIPLDQLEITETPKVKLRMVNHWDDPAGHVERGYAGNSIFSWDNMSDLSARDTMYMRLMASIGINASSINNVNTKTNRCIGWKLLQTERIDDLVPFATLLNSYGINMYISVNFAAPILIDGLDTADPLNPSVIAWWEEKAAECFAKLPGFGGFLVKADSEGEPGPITYGRNHAEGANMLAAAVAPYDGLIIWRAFVYALPGLSDDGSRHAFENFHPLDGQFKDNVIIQSKNGSVDFQVREPVAPLFGGLPRTNMNLELQITQEYTGQATHLIFLVPQWKEVLAFDTHATGAGTTVSQIVNGTAFNYKHSGIAGVLNFGDDYNWTGHYLAQANTYGFGRLAWNPNLSSEAIAEEWIKLTYGNNPEILATLSQILLNSWRTFEAYTSPLGSGMLSDIHHYDPDMNRRKYVLNADNKMLGRDRTQNGSNYTGDYHEPITSLYNSIETIPDELLLFFHRVPYTHQLQSGKTVIQHIYDTHFEGVNQAMQFMEQWESLKGKIDQTRYEHTLAKFKDQLAHAKVWRDHINGYFFYKSQIKDAKGRLTKGVKIMFPMEGK